MKTILYVPDINDTHKVLREEFKAHPPTARKQPEISVTHKPCLDCDSWNHRGDDAEQHCWDCDCEWPCPHAGQKVIKTPEKWYLCRGESNKPIGGEALVLVWEGKVVSVGIDRLARIFNRTQNPDYTLVKPGMEMYTFYDIKEAQNYANRFRDRFGGLVIELDVQPEKK